MKRTDRKGFTLIELMIVVAIIAVIAAIAIPSLMQSKMAANETRAIGALKAYNSAQNMYRRRKGTFTNTFAKLESDYTANPLLDKSICVATKAAPYSGYYFGEADSNVNWTFQYNLGAAPSVYNTSGLMSFITDQSANIWQKDTTVDTLPSALPDATWILSGG